MSDKLERKFASLTVHIKRDLCIGSGNCVKVAPEVFVLDESSIVTFHAEPSEIERGRLIDACAVCPVDALRAFDDQGRQIVPPA